MERFVIIVNGWKHSILDVVAALDPPLRLKRKVKQLLLIFDSYRKSKIKQMTQLKRKRLSRDIFVITNLQQNMHVSLVGLRFYEVVITKLNWYKL